MYIIHLFFIKRLTIHKCTLLDCIKHKCQDSYVLYIPTVHAFGSVLLAHTLLVQTHKHTCLETNKYTSVLLPS